MIRKDFLKTLTVVVLLMSAFISADAQSHQPYFSTVGDGNILSTSILGKINSGEHLTTLRYTTIVNFGINLNLDFSDNVGAYIGAGIKNIGFIEKVLDSTFKRRVYALGFPVGLKIGNLYKGNYLVIGGGIDLPFHFKEKRFVKRGNKVKINEWFSSRTPVALPFVFAGFRIKQGLDVKLNYYPGNFLNRNYTERGTNQFILVRPYGNYERTNLINLSFGFDVPYKPKDFSRSAGIKTKNI